MDIPFESFAYGIINFDVLGLPLVYDPSLRRRLIITRGGSRGGGVGDFFISVVRLCLGGGHREEVIADRVLTESHRHLRHLRHYCPMFLSRTRCPDRSSL